MSVFLFMALAACILDWPFFAAGLIFVHWLYSND